MTLPELDYVSLRNIRKKNTTEGKNPCLLCKTEITGKCKFIVLDETLSVIVDPETPEPTGGCHPIGLGCARKHPELKKYFLPEL